LDNAQIGHIQVALTARVGVGAGDCADERGVEVPGVMRASAGDAYLGTGLLIDWVPRLTALGKSVILGDDLTTNPA
jgi:hypothetical protein